jgi:predicted TIM-barrel fold metal-dependent hydrolase
MNEKADKLLVEAQSALAARYYEQGYQLFRQAVDLYKQADDPAGAGRCEKELKEAQQKYQACAPFPAIDYHAHPVFRDALKNDPPLYMAAKHFRVKPDIFPADIEGMIRHMDEANIEKAVIMAFDTSASDHWAFTGKKITNDDVAAFVRQYPDRFIGYGSVDPRRPDAVEETERCIKELGFKGMKFHPGGVGVYPNDEKLFYPIYEKCVELGVPVQSHCGTTGLYFTKIKYTMPIYYDDVAVDFPTLKLVLLHFGIGGWYEQAMAVAFRHPNVCLDISGASPRIIPRDLLVAANTPFYQNKIIFGTDYPFVGMAQWFSTYNKAIGDIFTEETKVKVFRENALKLHEQPPVSPLDLLRQDGLPVPEGAKR